MARPRTLLDRVAKYNTASQNTLEIKFLDVLHFNDIQHYSNKSSCRSMIVSLLASDFQCRILQFQMLRD